jgi:predicted CopG family antitoxin
MVKTEWRVVRLRLETYEKLVARKHGMDSISDVIEQCLDTRTIPKDQKTLAIG